MNKNMTGRIGSFTNKMKDTTLAHMKAMSL
jgi:hypothetical protein